MKFPKLPNKFSQLYRATPRISRDISKNAHKIPAKYQQNFKEIYGSTKSTKCDGYVHTML